MWSFRAMPLPRFPFPSQSFKPFTPPSPSIVRRGFLNEKGKRLHKSLSTYETYDRLRERPKLLRTVWYSIRGKGDAEQEELEKREKRKKMAENGEEVEEEPVAYAFEREMSVEEARKVMGLSKEYASCFIVASFPSLPLFLYDYCD